MDCDFITRSKLENVRLHFVACALALLLGILGLLLSLHKHGVRLLRLVPGRAACQKLTTVFHLILATAQAFVDLYALYF